MNNLVGVAALCLVLGPLGGAPRAHAWHDEGHVYSATAAVRALPEEVPAFFRDGARAVAHGAIDPDLMRQDKLPQLKAAAGPEHYFDREYLRDNPIPATRYEFIALCEELDIPATRVGFLPYSIAEATQRLTVAFAEHRADPDNAYVRMKCLVYAGWLAHYAADLHQPLHTTVHWDGRADEQFHSPRTGIHARIDALPTKLPYNAMFEQPLGELQAQEEVFPFVKAELARSFERVDRVYELEPNVAAHGDLSRPPEAVRRFTRERMRAAARFIAVLQLTAWRKSAQIDLPHWLDREAYDEGFDESKIPPQPGSERE